MNSQSKIVEKVRRLLALSKSDNMNEAAAAAAVANKFIIQYRIYEADLIVQDRLNNVSHIDPIYDDPEPVWESAHVTPWKLHLLCKLAHFYGCALWNDKSFGSSKGGRNTSRFRLIGRLNDVKFTKYMFHWLIKEIQKHAEPECRGGGHAKMASYCYGAVKGIGELLGKAREQAITLAQDKGKITALAQIGNRECEAYDYMYRKYHLAKPSNQKPKFDSGAYRKGIDLGNQLGKSINPSDDDR